jgi:tetratricopeptide (TPR) repeat protein
VKLRDGERPEEALAFFDAALEVTKGTFAPALRGKGILMMQVDKDPEAALQYFLRGLEIMPSNVPLLRTTAIQLIGAGPFPSPEVQKQVMGYLTRALELEPNNVPTLIAASLAKLQYYQDMKGAEVLLKKAADICLPANRYTKGRCYRLLGHMYYDKAQNARALDAFNCALRFGSDEPTTLVSYAAALAAVKGNTREALEEAEVYFTR